MNEFISPFYVSLIDVLGGNYKFIVNAGDINSFILSTYKAKYKNILNKEENILKVQEDDYYAVNLQKEKSFKFGTSWTPTFTTNSSCDVYLTIPKIPAGFITYSPITAFDKMLWWTGMSPLDFLNQFKIVTSIDENFETDYIKNTFYIDKDTAFRTYFNGPKVTQFLDDIKYPGKIYIKLASIKIDNGKVSIENFFKSEVISPTRFIRYGNTKLLNEKYIARVIALTPNSLVTYDLDFNSPLMVDKDSTSGNSTSEIIDKIQNILRYYKDAGADTDIELRYYLESTTIWQIIKVHKNELGGKLKIENLYENVSSRNALINIASRKGYYGSENIKRPMSEAGAISYIFSFAQFDLDPFVDDIIEDENPDEEEGGSASQEESSTNADEGELLEEVISEGDAYPDINLIKNFVELVGFTP